MLVLRALLVGMGVYVLSALGQQAQAQRENANWYFGSFAAVNFPVTGAPVALSGSSMNTYEACAAVSDSQGQLLFYTNSETIWTSQGQPMVNGTNLGGYASATQGVEIVQNPANAQQYYVFVVDAIENALAGGLKYSVVDMSRQAGRGEVITTRNQVSMVRLTEKLTTVPHANGRDTWVLVHGWQSNAFYAYQLTGAGLQPAPVASAVGSVHAGGGSFYASANAVGYLRASPSGQKLALGMRDSNFELYDFNPATGQVTNYVSLPAGAYSYGVEFSPDSRLLYTSPLGGGVITQYDLQAGSVAAIASSGVQVAAPGGTIGALKMGPDNRLYAAIYGNGSLAVINQPNVRGTGCDFQANAVALTGQVQVGLPNYGYRQAASAGSPGTPTPTDPIAAVAIPNVITPNGDAQNEYFEPKGLVVGDWHLRIFDRWGRLVYEQQQYDNRWNASSQTDGLYYYSLKKEATGQHYKGWVEVVRP